MNTAAERLSRTLLIALLANASAETTRVDEALETLQGILFSVRAGASQPEPEPRAQGRWDGP